MYEGLFQATFDFEPWSVNNSATKDVSYWVSEDGGNQA